MHRTRSDNATCPFGPELERYWAVRRDIWSRWDEGILTDGHGLFTAKPEDMALRLAEAVSGLDIVDGMCGVGGTAIAFARTGHKVTAVDHDASRLEMAKHNARIYGVYGRITFVQADILTYLPTAQADTVFIDPDWGGPMYRCRDAIRLSELRPDGRTLIEEGLCAAPTMVLCLPANSDRDELRAMSGYVQEWRMWNRVVCVTAAFARYTASACR